MSTNNSFTSPNHPASNDVLSPTTAFRDVTIEGEHEQAEPREQDDQEDDHQDLLELDVHHAVAAGVVTLGAHIIETRRHFDAMDVLRGSVELLSHPTVFIPASDAAALEAYHAATAAAVSKAERRLADCAVETDRRYTDRQDMLAEVLLGEGRNANHPLVYSRPVHLPPTVVPHQTGTGATILLDEVSAVALYNLALAHHLAGTSRAALSSYDPARTRTLIDKALALYGMAESLLAQLHAHLLHDDADEAATSAPHLLLSPGESTRLSMALANNAGAILLGDGRDHRRGRERFERLHDFIIATQLAATNDAASADEDEFDAGFFKLNVLAASQMNGAPVA